MNKRLSANLACLLLTPFLHAETPSGTPPYVIPRTYLRPIDEALTDRTRSLTLIATQNGYFRPYVVLNNSLVGSALLNPTGFPSEEIRSGYVLVAPKRFEGHHVSSTNISVVFTLPKDYLQDYGNLLRLGVLFCPDGQTTYRDYGVDFSISVYHPRSFSLQNPLIFKESKQIGSYLSYPTSSINSPWEIHHEGFLETYNDPPHSLLPFKDLKLWNIDQIQRKIRFTAKTAYLRLYGSNPDIPFGRDGHDQAVSWKDFDLLFYWNPKGGYSYPVLANAYYVSLDGRYMQSESAHASSAVLTNQFYLPPVKNSESRKFTFQYFFEGCGLESKDNIKSSQFVLTKTHNYMGSFVNSEYAVEVET
jgi:hypothetical protein